MADYQHYKEILEKDHGMDEGIIVQDKNKLDCNPNCKTDMG
jgi:hypothetical protein